jgi:hypothetical protein
MDTEIPAAAHSGGYRTTAAASDHHAVRAAFQSGSDLIAEYAQHPPVMPKALRNANIDRLCTSSASQ